MKNYIRSLYWYIAFGASLLIKWLQMITLNKNTKNMTPNEFDWHIFRITQKWAQGHLNRAKCEVIVTGNTNYPDGSVLFVSNHQSNFDTALLMTKIEKPKGYIAKETIKKAPILKDWMLVMHSVFIDRDNPKKAGKAILEGIQILKDGHSLVIFAEGTRSKSNKMGEFKDGAFMLAIKSGVPIIPITICDTHKILEANNNIIIPGTTYLHVHDPIPTENLSKKDLSELSKNIYEIIEKKLNELDKK